MTPTTDFICIVSFSSFIIVIWVHHRHISFMIYIDGKNKKHIEKRDTRLFLEGWRDSTQNLAGYERDAGLRGKKRRDGGIRTP